GAVLGRGLQALAIQQHQGAVLPEIAQVEEVAAAVAAAAAEVTARRTVLENRQLVQAVRDGARGGGQQLVGADGGDGRRRIGDVRDDARTGDDDRFRRPLRGLAAPRLCRLGLGADWRAEQTGEQCKYRYAGF